MIVYRNFDGDVRQAIAGVAAAHGVTFKEATTVFSAEDLAISEDPATGELRAVGTSNRGRKLVVLHQRGQRIRILHIALDGVPESENEAWNVANNSAREAPTTALDAPPPSSVTGATLGALRVVSDAASSDRGADSNAAATHKAEPSRTVRVERATASAASAASSTFGAMSSTFGSASSTFGAASPVRRGPGRPRRVPSTTPTSSASVSSAKPAPVASVSSAKPAHVASVSSEPEPRASLAASRHREPEAIAPEPPSKRREPEAIAAPVSEARSKRREPEAIAAPVSEAKSKRREPEAIAAPVSEARSKRREPEAIIAPEPTPKHHEPATRAARAGGRSPDAARAEPAVTTSPAPTNGWTAEAYDIYWAAYSAARDEARRQGKSTREAQLLGRAAGDRAAATRSEPSTPSASSPTAPAARGASAGGRSPDAALASAGGRRADAAQAKPSEPAPKPSVRAKRGEAVSAPAQALVAPSDAAASRSRPAAPAAAKRSSRVSSWRAAARAVKMDD